MKWLGLLCLNYINLLRTSSKDFIHDTNDIRSLEILW